MAWPGDSCGLSQHLKELGRPEPRQVHERQRVKRPFHKMHAPIPVPPPAWNTRRPPAKSEAATDGRLPAAPNSTRAPCAFTASSCAARAGSGDGVSYGRAVVRRVCGHVARRLAAQRGQVCQERRAIEFPAVPAALPAPECHVPRSPFRRAATITARAAHRTGAVIFAPDAPPPRPPLQRRFQVGPVRYASPEPPAFRGPLRRFLRASLINGSPRASASRITAETDVCVASASASASSAAAVAGSTVTRNCFE